MNEEKMIACPFCGWVETSKEKSEHIIVDGATTLQCRRCKATGPQTFDVNAGVEAWNKRAGGQQTATPETGGAKGVGISDLLSGVELINAERKRQIRVEGWTPEHDDKHHSGELADAAACYAAGCHVFIYTHDGEGQAMGYDAVWPWGMNWWKPCANDRIRELTKAGALIAAEIDRIQRVQKSKPDNDRTEAQPPDAAPRNQK